MSWTLKRQIDKLIQEGYLGQYVKRTEESNERPTTWGRQRSPERQDRGDLARQTSHVVPAKGESNIIAGGFLGGGSTNSCRKRYVRLVLSVDLDVSDFPTHPPIVFMKEDFEGIYPHENDPMVILAVSADYRVKRVLVDQGSSADILYWDTFEWLGLGKRGHGEKSSKKVEDVYRLYRPQ